MARKLRWPRFKMPRMPAFVEQSAFLRQTWALLQRNAILHVHKHTL